MNDHMRLLWEPNSLAPADVVARQVSKYMDNKIMFAQFNNGTCLMLKPLPDLDTVIRGCMEEAKYLPDFKVHSMEDGDFLVNFTTALMVYVGKEEFERREEEVRKRYEELKFPGESFLTGTSPHVERDELIGLYGRGKLQRDAYLREKYEIKNPFAS